VIDNGTTTEPLPSTLMIVVTRNYGFIRMQNNILFEWTKHLDRRNIPNPLIVC